MKCNVGKEEKIARYSIAVITAILGYLYSPWWYILTFIGIITAAISYCPLTDLFGINTCKKIRK